MLSRIFALPFIVILMGIGALSMLAPSAFAFLTDEFRAGRVFLFGSLFFTTLTAMIALATASQRIRRRGRSHLIALLAAYTVLPVMLAVPFAETLRDTSFLNAYIEMVSSFTTTGATLFPPERLPPSLHLWRAQVGWMGGFFVWLTVIAILAPMNLGGFEIRARGEIGQGAALTGQIAWVADTSERLQRFAAQLFPVYAGLTLFLWIGLVISGDAPFIALCHAMSVMATSGISPVGGLENSGSGVLGEMLIFAFFIFAITRASFNIRDWESGPRTIWQDSEFRLGALLIVTVPVLLYLRHWLDATEEMRFIDGVLGLWGGAFTVASYLTTTGFLSAGWDEAQLWSGLATPGLILMGLAVFGGGVATTAGGVKLLRVYALYRHGLREMEKLTLPSSVAGAGDAARRLRREGAYAAWVFFMLFALSIAVVMAGFALAELPFEEGLVLTIAGLSTTGPLTQVALASPIDLNGLTAAAKLVFAAAMVIGRLETLAIIALLNPAFWR